MGLKEKTAEKILSHAIALRVAQKMRLSVPEGPAKETVKELEHNNRKKLNDAVDLYLRLPGVETVVALEKER